MTKPVPLDAAYPQARRDDAASHTYPSPHQGKDVAVPEPYAWLESPPNASEEVDAWVKAQAKLTEDYLAKVQPMRDAIQKDISRIWSYPRMSAPTLRPDGYYYFSFNSGLQSQSPIYRVAKDNIGQADQHRELFFDPNLLSQDGTVSVGSSSFSKSARYWGYTVSRSGSDWKEIYVRKTDSPHDPKQPRGTDEGRLPDVVKWIKSSGPSWTHDEQGFFYGRYPAPANAPDSEAGGDKAGTEVDANYNYKVYYHRLGTEQSEDILVSEDTTSDKSSLMSAVSVTDDGQYALLYTSRDTSRKCLLSIAKIDGPITPSFKDAFKTVVTEWEADFEEVANQGPLFYFKTNFKAGRDKVVTYNFEKPEEGFKDLVPESKAVLVGAFVRGGDKLLLLYKEDVVERLYLHELNTGERICELEAGDIGAFEALAGRREQSEFFISKGGYTNPSSMFRVNLDQPQGKMVELFRETKLEGINTADYETTQEFYESPDGTRIPIFIVAPKNLKRDGTAPTLLYGYGGFSISIDPGFSPSFMSFMKGFNGVVAVANIRGGGEYGEAWHESGIKEKRQNVFEDFKAAARYLKDTKWAGPITISGGSNGGALVAACANQAPELFDAMIPEVGVLDLLRYQNFTIGWAWASDYGRADQEGAFDYLIKWSPLHNIPSECSKYPATLLMTGEYDDRVSPLHSFKFGAALQHALPQNPNPLLLRVELKAGHGAGKSTEQRIASAADKWTFVAETLGLTWRSDK